jgi:hypothetical protein
VLNGTCDLCAPTGRVADHPCGRCARVAEFKALRAKIEAERDDLFARAQDVEAEIADLEARPLEAAWRRISAQASRTRASEDHARAHAAWVVFMADLHLRSETVPEADASVSEIEGAMDDLRALRAMDPAATDAAAGRAEPGAHHAGRGRALPLPDPIPAA